MPRRIDYSVTRVPTKDWDNIMETVTLDGSYSQEIKDEIWTAIGNIEDFSYPWVVVIIKEGMSTARIYSNEETARKQFERLKRQSSDAQLFFVKGEYKS